MSNMIYGGSPFEKSALRARWNYVLGAAKVFFFQKGITHDKETHFECGMQKKWKIKRKHAVANYFIESEMNDLITHDSIFFYCAETTTILNHDMKNTNRMRAMHMHDNKW